MAKGGAKKTNKDYFTMPVDLARYPIFSLSNRHASGFNGEFFVDGELCVSIKGPNINSNAADVFYALVDEAKKKDFKDNRVSFTTSDLFKILNLNRNGQNYEKIHSAIDSLFEVSIKIHGNTGLGRLANGMRLITYYYLKEHEGNEENPAFSCVEFSNQLLENFREGRLKLVHPVYFKLRGSLEKRLFSLISVRAFEEPTWDLELFTLRDLVPLTGKKYATASGIMQRLDPALKKLKKLKIIHGYTLSKTKNKKNPLISIEHNHEYFYSRRRPALQLVENSAVPLLAAKNNVRFSKEQEELLTLLRTKKISLPIAKKIVQDHSKDYILEKIQIADRAALNNKKIRSLPAFLIQAIRDDYEASLSPAEVLANEQQTKRDSQKEQIAEIKRLISKNKSQEALELCQSIMSKQREITPFSETVKDLMKEAKKAVNTQESGELSLFPT